VTAYYLDTSALVKRYAQESGTPWVLDLTDPMARHDLYTVRVAGPEMIAAIFRKLRMGEVSPEEAVRSADNFRKDWQQRYQIVEVTAGVADRAMELAEKHGLRGYDSVHLAAALALQHVRRAMELLPLTFVSADAGQLETAVAEGLAVEDPNRHC
jgi:predicted nucleic acid-binding protein